MEIFYLVQFSCLAFQCTARYCGDIINNILYSNAKQSCMLFAVFPLYLFISTFYLIGARNEVPCAPILYIWIFSEGFSFTSIRWTNIRKYFLFVS